jgi:hypothetical protein
MPVTKRYGLYGVHIATTLLPGITRQSIRFGSTIRNEPRSGEPYSRFQSLVAQKPGATFSTESIAAAIDLVPLLGYSLVAEVNGLRLYTQQWLKGGTREGTLKHVQDQIKIGILALRRLNAEHQGDAVLDLEAIAGWNGSDTDGPILRTKDITLPAAVADADRFTLGKITVGAIALTQFRSVELDFGIEINSEGSESEIWDSFITIRSIQPRLTVRGINPLWFQSTGAIPMIGKAGTHANTSIYLRKRANGGTFVPDATVEHISITGDGYATIEMPMDANGLEATEANLVMEFRYDGTNIPLLIDTTSAIP